MSVRDGRSRHAAKRGEEVRVIAGHSEGAARRGRGHQKRQMPV